MREMRILYFFPGVILGGAELKTFQLCRNLKKHGHKAFVACADGSCAELAIQSEIQFLSLPIKHNSFGLWEAFRAFCILVRFIRKRRVQIIVTFRRNSALVALLVSKVTGIRHVYMNVCVYNDKPWIPLKSDFTIANSRACFTNAVNFLGLDSKRIALVRIGVDRPKIILDKKASRDLLKIENNSFLVGTVCRLVEQKGVDILIRSIANVNRTLKDVKLIVVGEGPEMQSLIELQHILKMPQGTVIMLGPMDNVWDLLPALDVYVCSSVAVEGLSNALVEAAACSIPLIGTNVGGTTEVVIHNWNGIVVPPSDEVALTSAIMDLAKRRDSLCSMGSNAKRLIDEMFSIEVEVREHIRIYETLLINNGVL